MTGDPFDLGAPDVAEDADGPTDRPVDDVDDDEARWARAALASITEPGDRALHDFVIGVGGAQALGFLRTGRGVAGLAGAERYRARIDQADPGAVRSRTVRAGARVVVPGDPEWMTGLALLTRAGRARLGASAGTVGARTAPAR